MSSVANKARSISKLIWLFILVTLLVVISSIAFVWNFAKSSFVESEPQRFVCGTCESQMSDEKKAENYFIANCSNCHCNPNLARCEQSLQNVRERTPGNDWIYTFLNSETKLIVSGEAYTLQIRKDYLVDSVATGFTHSFANLSKREIDEILDYVDGK